MGAAAPGVLTALWVLALGLGWAGWRSWQDRKAVRRRLARLVRGSRVEPPWWRQAVERYRRRWRRSQRAASLHLRAEEYWGAIALAVLVPGLLGLLWRGPAGGLILALAGGGGTVAWFRARQARWFAQGEAELPEFFRGVSSAMRAGSSLPQALALVAEETPEPLKGEVERVLRRQSLGYGFDEVLTELAERLPSRDLDLAVTAIMVQREVGGSLATVLDSIVEAIVDRQRLRNEIRTLTAQGRLSGWILTLLPPALGLAIWFLDPAYLLPFLSARAGLLTLVYVVVSLALGFYVIRLIIRRTGG
ncbi:MAG: type II secretion system F family protein [Firmicutes bacterium]|nr:type II secretion system F family protein [Bacillota bacterium]